MKDSLVVTSYDQLRLTNKICYLIPTCLDLQILARKLLPVATIVRLAIFIIRWNMDRDICKTGNFDRQFSPWKRRLQKKRSTPRRRQRKMQENCHLRFLIFELSSQRFFDLKLTIFRFLKNSKKRNFLQTCPPNFGFFLNT